MESGFIVTTKQTSIIERGPAGSYLRLNYQAMGYSAKALLNEAGFEKVFRKQIPAPSRYGPVHDHCLLTFPNAHVPFKGPDRVTAGDRCQADGHGRSPLWDQWSSTKMSCQSIRKS
jgi:hypothetical protein